MGSILPRGKTMISVKRKLLVAAGVLGIAAGTVRYAAPLAEVTPYAYTQFTTAVPPAFRNGVTKGVRELVKAPLYAIQYPEAVAGDTRDRYDIIVNKTTNEAAIIRDGVLDTLVPVSTGVINKPTKTRYGEYVTPDGDYLVKGRRDSASLERKFDHPSYYGAGQLLLVGPFGGDIALHGTNSTSTIGSYETNGCVRFDNRTMASLLDRVSNGSHIRIRSIPQAAWRDTVAAYRR